MKTIPSMVDMALTPEESEEQSPVPSTASDQKPMYPWGLRLNLCQDELEKLGLAEDDLAPGDMVHFHAMATVISVSTNKSQDGDDHCSIALQVTHMSAEDEDEENEEEEKAEDKGRLKKLYL